MKPCNVIHESLRGRLPVAFLTASLVATANAAPADAETWREFNALKFYVSDELDGEAAVYTSKGHFLVDPGDSPFIYLLSPKQFAVHRAAADDFVAENGTPTVDSGDLRRWDKLNVLEKTGPALSWEDDAGRYALSAKPPLLGETTLDELRKFTNKYELEIEEYEPDVDAIASLSGIAVPTDIIVGFGLWCSVCAEWLPRFVKTIEAADNEHLRVRYLSVNEDLDRPADLLDEFRIDSVPTFVLIQDEEEIARIDLDYIDLEGEPLMEKMLIDVLNLE